jgi:predicted ATPase
MNDIASIYAERRTRFATLRDHIDRRWNQLANLRLLLFVLALGAAALGWGQSQPWLFALAALLLLGFLVAVGLHYRLGLRRTRYATLATINREGEARLARNWASLPPRDPLPATLPPLVGDLDLLGQVSLEQLLSTAATPIGRNTLRDWLLTPATPEVIVARQEAVRELAPLRDWRDELQLGGRLITAPQSQFEALAAWAGQSGWLRQLPWLIWLSRALALFTVGALLAQAFNLIAFPLGMLGVAANILLTLLYGLRADRALAALTSRHQVVDAYAQLFRLLGSQEFRSPQLRAMQRELRADGLDAAQQLTRLSRIMALADLRGNILYLVLQFTTLLSFHTLWLLEGWQRVAGARLSEWLRVLGEFEALAALAALHHDQPDWAFPAVDVSADTLEVQGIGHPLLSDRVRIANDVQLGPPGSFLLVTGSNMAGKSTLLRAIGLNVVLAQAGGPVCAQQLRLPPLELATAVRVQDSLEEGVSYFMAELQRLKQVVERAEELGEKPEDRRQETGDKRQEASEVRSQKSEVLASVSTVSATNVNRRLLYLLDEILHGTNSAERQIAARRIVRHLVDQGAIGAVSTHDLDLATTPELAQIAVAVHFAEQFERTPAGPQMSFDYRLRPGIATSTNALKLMEIIGLDFTTV